MAEKISGSGRRARSALARTIVKPAEYHQQDENYFCGAACAQMVLSCLGRPVDAPDDQSDIQTVIRNNNDLSTWASDPVGLAFVLNFPPLGYQHPVAFKHKEETSKETLTARVVTALDNFGVPPVVLVWGTEHWIIVTEFETGNTVDDIVGFMIFNPAPYLAEPNPIAGVLPPPHGPGDNCGTGYENVSTFVVNRAVKNHHLSYAGWACGYLTAPVDWEHGSEDPEGEFAIVCVSQAADQAIADSAPFACSVPQNGGSAPEVSFSRALASAWQGMLDHHLDAKAAWKAIFQGVPAGGDHDSPIPIFRSDTGKWFYAIPYYGLDANGNRRNRVATMVDGHLAPGRALPDYLESIAVENGRAMSEIDPEVLELLSTIPEAIHEEGIEGIAEVRRSKASYSERSFERGVIGRKIIVREGGRERVVVFKIEDLNKRTPLVWVPSQESLTPFDPFYLFEDPENREIPIYVRISDLKGYTRINNYLRGGLAPDETAKR